MKYAVGQKVTVSLKTLYDKLCGMAEYRPAGMACLEYGCIEYSVEDGNDYFDLYAGNVMACCDGETCIITKVAENRIDLVEEDGDVAFSLSMEEAETAVFLNEIQE